MNAELLSLDEIEQVNGGVAPVILGLAVLATTAKIGFVRGVFSGIRQKAQTQAADD